MTVDHETLTGWLTRLKLTAIRDQLDSLLDEAARRELTLREALAFLAEREVARAVERRIEMAGKIAHFPTVRASTASTSPRSLGRPAPDRELAACLGGTRRALLLLGPPVGKTHLAGRAAIPRRLLGPASPRRRGRRARQEAGSKSSASQAADHRRNSVLLRGNAAHLFFQLVSRRYERCLLLTVARSANGARSSATRWSRPRSSIACSTTATSSPSAATATGCAKSDGPAFCRRPARRSPTHPFNSRGASSSCRQGTSSGCRLTISGLCWPCVLPHRRSQLYLLSSPLSIKHHVDRVREGACQVAIVSVPCYKR